MHQGDAGQRGFQVAVRAFGKVVADLDGVHARAPLLPAMPKADQLLLRPLAGGRLLECLTPDGRPVLHSPVAGGRIDWPMRLAFIEGRFYAIR